MHIYYLTMDTHIHTHASIQMFTDRSNSKKPDTRQPIAGTHAPGLIMCTKKNAICIKGKVACEI